MNVVLSLNLTLVKILIRSNKIGKTIISNECPPSLKLQIVAEKSEVKIRK